MTTLNQAEKQQEKPKAVKASHVFAAFRDVLIQQFRIEIQEDLIPKFKAAMIDLDKQKEEIIEKYHNEALAENRLKALKLEVLHARDQDIEDIKKMFNTEISAHIRSLKGERLTEEVKNEFGDVKFRNVVKFPDGSKAQVQRLFIPYADFN